MNWLTDLLEGVRRSQQGASPQTAEQCAWSALALATVADEHGQLAGERLAEAQAADGSVGMWLDDSFPRWPTSLAVLAWLAVDPAGTKFQRALDLAIKWIVEHRGRTIPISDDIGHNSMLDAWPWVLGTHSWIEPTAFHVLALTRAGRAEHSRVKSARAMLLDRQLPGGGCNYGNTMVLGQTLRAHVQPTGIAMLALAEPDAKSITADPRVEASLLYLEREVGRTRTVSSLAWAALGLAAHGRKPAQLENWLRVAWQRQLPSRRTPQLAALTILAAHAERSVLLGAGETDESFTSKHEA